MKRVSIMNVVASVCIAMLFAMSAIATEIMPSFANVPTGWTTDRYEPASFLNVGTYQGRPNVLGIGINNSTASINRPGGQQGSFYNTQGRKYSFSPKPGAGSILSARLYIPASWEFESNGAVRSDIWATMVDASDVVSAYPIIGFTNHNGGGRYRVWDGATWVNLPTPVVYNSWTTFSIKLNADSSFDFSVNGSVVFTDTTTNSSAAFQDVIMQAFNFDEPSVSPPAVSNAPYVAHWSNIGNLWAIQADFLGNSTITGFTTRSLRGLALSQDNDHVYAGFIQGTSTGVVRRVPSSMISGQIGPIEVGGDPSSIQGEITGMTAKARAIATDDRGYVYMVRSSNSANIRFETYSANLGTLISNYELSGVTPATEMNGLSVQNIGGTYYLYVSRGSTARIYRYNVTNPASPTVDTTWANSGMLDIKALSGNVNASLSGMEVDTDGTIYSAGGFTLAGRDSVFKIAADGSSMISASVNGAMDVALFASRVYVSQYLANNSSIDVRNKSNLSFIETLFTGVPHTNTSADSGYSGIDISDDGRIYVADQLPVVAAGAVIPDRVLVSSPLEFAPVVTINQAIGQNDPTDTSPINFTVTFDQAVTGFDGSDVVLGGTAGATTAVVTGGPTVYNVAVSGMTASGTVTATVPANSAINTNGNGNESSTSTDNSVTFSLLPCINISAPVVTSKTGVPVTIPITSGDVTGRGVISADMTFSYNPAVISFASVTPGPVLSGTTIINFSNDPVNGVLIVSIFEGGASEFSGVGTLIDLNFNVVGPIGSSTALTLNSFWYNGTLVCSTTTNGSLTVISGEISGQITYAHQPGVKPVPGATLNAPGVPNVSGVTNAGGNYLLSGFGPGPYTVTPSKPNKLQACDAGYSGPNGIFSNDASAISQHIVNIAPIPTAAGLNAAWVSEGTTPFLSSFDAALISQWIVCINNPINLTGQWRFTPTNRFYSDVIADYLNQDYSGLLKGDVTGDWSDTGPLRPAPMTRDEEARAVRASVSDIKADQGTLAIVPFRIDNLRGLGITSYQFDVEFDPDVLTADEVAADLTGTLSQTLTVVSNSPSKGLLKVVVYGAWPSDGDGVYVNLRFRTIGDVGSSSPLTISQFRFNDGSVRSVTVDGKVTVTNPAGIRLNGRLLNSRGRGTGEAIVTLTGTNGEVFYARSNQLGLFEFVGLTLGETYTISVQSEAARFTPIHISITGEQNSVRLIAE